MNIDIPKVSVLVPVYKVEAYLQRCIDSVLAQDFQDWELILVDDGSPDRCPQICDEAARKDPRIIVIHKKNEGALTARYAGFNMAKGEYIMFLDADDTLPGRAISFLMQEINNGYDIVRGGHINVDSKGNLVEKENYENNNILFNSGEEFAIALHKGLVTPYLWGGIYRKTVINDSFFHRIINYNLTIGEDCVMNMFISRNVKKVRIIPQIVYYYYINPSSVMHTKIMGREYAHRIDECISEYVKTANEEVRQLFILNQVKGAISRDFQKEISFSMNDYRFVINYIKDKNNKTRLYMSMSYKYLLFIDCLPFYYIYSRLFSYYRWIKMGMRKRRVID